MKSVILMNQINHNSISYTQGFIESITNISRKEITETRFNHVRRVAEIAKELGTIYAPSEISRLYVAGILHDITKQKKDEVHLDLFSEFAFSTDGIPKEAYHAFSAPFYLKKHINFEDPVVFSGISSHTLGGREMTTFQKILYAADFLGSDYAKKSPFWDEWFETTKLDLNFGVLLKAKKTIESLLEKNSPIHIFTIETYNESVRLIQQDNK